MREDVRVANSGQRATADTASRVLDVAERLLQTRGYNGFSYANVAAELKLTKASLHYHYASKATMGQALITRYAARFAAALEEIDARPIDAPAKLAAYAHLYADVFRGKRMCMCGMLAAEYRTLPKPMRDAVVGFFDDNEAWLTDVLTRGREDGTLRFTGSPDETAQMIVSGLEGAMLVARPYDDMSRFQAAADRLLENLAGPDPGRVGTISSN
jgi:TetR/AcrR family transcriptional repressor of nem operon